MSSHSSMCLALLLVVGFAQGSPADELPGTKPMQMQGDIASELVDGVDRFLLKQIRESAAVRGQYWSRDDSSPEAYARSVDELRQELRHIAGLRGELQAFQSPRLVATVDEFPALLSRGGDYVVSAVQWPVVDSLTADGLLIVPADDRAVADVVLIPDADQPPEEIAESAGAVLAASGCRVLIVRTVSRTRERRRGRADLTNREYLHRSAFELGRTLIGYETQMALAAVNWFAGDDADRPVGVMGLGEGGFAALLAAAVDVRVDVVCVSGFFGPRENAWNEPLDRNLFGLLKKFGAAELLSMVAPRRAVVSVGPGVTVDLPGNGGAPAELRPIAPEQARAEFGRARKLTGAVECDWVFTRSPDFGLSAFLKQLGLQAVSEFDRPEPRARISRTSADAQRELVERIDRYNQWLLSESPFVRREFMKGLDTSSIEAYEKSVEPYRQHFAEKTIGQFETPLLPPNPRTRTKYSMPTWTGYEVVLDVFPDVIAYGILLLPKDLKPNEKRPVVVCQHGLEGRPTDVIEGDHRAYHDFAAKLCERGFVVFAPQNLYIFKDRFRTLQRKANPLGKTLFSVIVPQHQQIVNWLKTLPHVDASRIAFYGLSYGGKSAMRIPPLVTDYCLSICSADFNEWVLKNASTRHNFSYVWTGEYEIFEFDLGSTFNYAEMAALIAPRPFMVERGHFDGVGTDEWVAYEFAKVRNLYAARLGIGDRCEIEWFVGPHTINGQGTFDFLHRHLQWPEPRD